MHWHQHTIRSAPPQSTLVRTCISICCSSSYPNWAALLTAIDRPVLKEGADGGGGDGAQARRDGEHVTEVVSGSLLYFFAML